MSEENIKIDVVEADEKPSKQVEFKEETETIPQQVEPKKQKKPRKPMSAEHKAKVIAGLAKAREKSAIARAKKKEVRKIKKVQADEEIDNIIREDLMKKTKKETDKDKRIKELEDKLASLTLQDVLKPKKKAKILDVEELTTIPEAEEQQEKPKPVQAKQPKVEAAVGQKAKVVAQAKQLEPKKEEKEIKTAVYRGRKKRGR